MRMTSDRELSDVGRRMFRAYTVNMQQYDCAICALSWLEACHAADMSRVQSRCLFELHEYY